MNPEKMTPILPKGRREERPLFVIMAIMSFLATLTLLLVLMGLRQSASWQNDLQSAVTVQVISQDPAFSIEPVIDILDDHPGIRSASALDSEANRALLAPWIGTADLPEDLILPSLIRVDIDREQFDAMTLQAELDGAGFETIVDDHQQWSRNLSSTWSRVRLALLSLLVIIFFATIAISSFATQSVLQARQNIINVLAQVGARDSFIARLFLTRFLSVGFKAAISGRVLALAFMALFMIFQNEPFANLCGLCVSAVQTS